MAAGSHMVEPGGGVPGQKKVALDIAVVGEDLTKSVEVEIIWITKPVCDGLYLPALGGKSNECSSFDVSNHGGGRSDMLRAKTGIIASDQIKPTIGPFPNSVAAVLARACRK